MKNLLPGLLFACTLLALVALFMRPRASVLDLNPQAAAEVTARVVAAEETERARIAAETERIRQRTTGSIVAFVVVGLAVPVSIAAWGFTRRQPPPPTTALVLHAEHLRAAGHDARLDVIDGEWHVVDDTTRLLIAADALPDHWSAL